MKSMAQIDRQRVRKGGGYAKMLACAKCDEPITGAFYQHVQDDPELQSLAVAAGLPHICTVCHKCARGLYAS